MFIPYRFERTYFSMNDMYSDIGSGPYAFRSPAQPSCYDFIDQALQAAGYTTTGLTPSVYLTNCWRDYIWPKFYDKAICFTDEPYKETDGKQPIYEAFANACGPIISWLIGSSEKYSLLIKNQEDNRTKLLGQIKSSSTQRFNDTPQNQGEFADDAHNTTVTKNEALTDGGTLLSRLNEIEDNLKRLYEDWSNEFRKFIFWSV